MKNSKFLKGARRSPSSISIDSFLRGAMAPPRRQKAPMTSASDGSSSSRPAEGTTAGPGVAPRAMTGISAPPALDRSGERRALEALRALLQNPPAAVEDDLPSQDWLAGLACMADYALLCNSAAMADAASGPERHRAAGINLSARETGSIAPPASGGGCRANHRQSHWRLAGSEA